MKIRAKFLCIRVTNDMYGNEGVELQPVYGDGKANDQWSEATPSGKLEMTISVKGAQGKFEPSKEYFLDISEAE